MTDLIYNYKQNKIIQVIKKEGLFYTIHKYIHRHTYIFINFLIFHVVCL